MEVNKPELPLPSQDAGRYLFHGKFLAGMKRLSDDSSCKEISWERVRPLLDAPFRKSWIMKRFLQHVVPERYVRIRHYGPLVHQPTPTRDSNGHAS